MKRSISFSIFQYNYLHLMRPQHTLYHQYIFSNHLIGRVCAKRFLCDILHFRCIGWLGSPEFTQQPNVWPELRVVG